jgi:hypothetical protein
MSQFFYWECSPRSAIFQISNFPAVKIADVSHRCPQERTLLKMSFVIGVTSKPLS